MAPETRYTRSGEVAIADQVFGDGPVDLLLAPGFVSHCEVLWEHPDVAHGFERLGSFGRVLLFDKREQGLSDRLGRPPTIEEMVDDMRAVLDAVGSERCAVFGISEGATSASRSGRAFTAANASFATTTSAGSRSTSARG